MTAPPVRMSDPVPIREPAPAETSGTENEEWVEFDPLPSHEVGRVKQGLHRADPLPPHVVAACSRDC